MNTIFGFGGICYLIVGIKATNEISRADKFWILFDKFYVWKNIPKFIILNKNKGKKIVAIATKGYLYNGILKWAYWKCYILLFMFPKTFYPAF